jgi:hypothetical protein
LCQKIWVGIIYSIKKKKYFQGGINMEMNDILNGINSCDEDCCESRTDSCSCGPSFGGFPGGFGQNITGCGFGSWIWILLILFYCGCGRNLGRGRYNNNCCCEKKNDCCDRGNYGGGLFGNCSSYLFLLVILFLCNTNNGNSGFCGIGQNIGCGTC